MGLFDKIAGKIGIKSGAADGAGNNSRNNAMVKEMKAFKENVKLLVKELTETSTKLSAAMTTVGQLMSQPLPRPYERATEPGLPAEAYDITSFIVGEGVDLSVISSAHTEMLAKVKSDVLTPLEAWLVAFTATKAKNHKCEDLSVALDAQRRVVISAAESLAEMQKKSHPKAGEAATKLEAEKDKEQHLLLQFTSLEAEVFNEMLQCIQEITELRRFSLTALQTMQACLLSSCNAYNMTCDIAIKLPARATGRPLLSETSHSAHAEATYPAEPTYEEPSAPPQPPSQGHLPNPFAK